jgi:hypothetical protein
MGRSRRARRRNERARVKRVQSAPTREPFTPITRALLVAGALVLAAGGIGMLAAGGSNAERLGRIAGIVLIVAVVLAYGGIRGRL